MIYGSGSSSRPLLYQSMNRLRMSFYDDATTNYAALDDFYCYDKSRTIEAENALDYVGSLLGFAN